MYSIYTSWQLTLIARASASSRPAHGSFGHKTRVNIFVALRPTHP